MMVRTYKDFVKSIKKILPSMEDEDDDFFTPLQFMYIMYETELKTIGITNDDGSIIDLGEDIGQVFKYSTLNTLSEKFYAERRDRLISKRLYQVLDDVENYPYPIHKKREFYQQMLNVANEIFKTYFEKWKRLYLALIDAEYNPIENYNSYEKITRDTTDTTHIETNSKIVSDEENKKYGYNVSDYSPTTETKTTNSGDVDDNYSDQTFDQDGTIETEKNGNIGVTTNQQMITQELELRDKFQFFEIVLNDIDDIILLQYK